MDTPERILSVDRLSVSFPAQQFEAVKQVSFTLETGKTLAIVGESGSGKSLIALSLIGLQPKQALVGGSIRLKVDGAMAETLAFQQKQWEIHRGNTVGFIFQEPMSALNAIQCVGRQIQENIEQHQQIGRKDARKKTLEWIAKVRLPDPESMYKRFPHQLSGGQKQRIMIAMAMCNRPSLLLADEPTTALDATVQKEVIQLMKSLQQETKTALVFITHDLALAAEIADEVLVMQQGVPVEYGPAAQVLQHPKEVYTRALLACRPDPANKGKKLPVIADYLSGKEGQEQLPTPTATPDEPLLSINDLYIRYPEGKSLFGKTGRYFTAVNGVSLTIPKGRTLGLVGESGCGKSTLGKSLMGLTPIHAGSIRFEGQELTRLNGTDWNTVRRNIQLIFQDPFASLNPRHTVGSIITEPLLIHRLMNEKNRQQEAQRLLDMVQLPRDAANRYPHQFSGGQRQRIGIARALSLNPSLLICDESVSALDVSVQAQVLNLLKELQQELGLAYLFISHDLSVVHYMADKIAVMQQGKIVEQAEANQLIYHPQEAYTRRLIAAIPERIA